MNFIRIRALVRKEGLQMYKDPSSIITAFIFPLVLLFLYGCGVSLDIKDLKIGIVMEDTSPLAHEFVDSLRYSEYFDVVVDHDRSSVEEMLREGIVKGFIVIPHYFSEYYYDPNRTAPLQVISDGSEPNTAQFVQNYIRGAWLAWQQLKLIESGSLNPPLVSIIPRVWFNEELKSQYFLVPGSIVVIITITGALLTSLVVAREWEKGTMEALISTPVTMGEILTSKFVAYFILGTGSLTLCFFVGHVVFGVPLRGSFFAIALSSAAYLSFTLGMGLLISFFARNQFAASQLAIVTTYLPSFILSGFIFDIDSMPLYLRVITYFVPARYYVENLKTLFLVGDVWELLLPNVAVILVISSGIFYLIIKKSVKRLD